MTALPNRTDRDTRGDTTAREIRVGSKVDRDLRPTERPTWPKDDMSAPASAACPRCGAFAPMLPIVFGLPMAETFEAAERGEIALGGCVVTGEDPTHQCTACGQEVIVDALMEIAFESCATCGSPLDGDPDDEPDGDAGMAICGECNRNRNFAAIEEVVLWDDSAQ